MPSFVIRVIQDQDAPQEFVGIYIANSIEQLDALVGRHCVTCACEYAQLPTDSLYTSQHAIPGPAQPYGGSDEPALFGEQTMGDQWHKLFFGDVPPMWVPLTARTWTSDDERHAHVESARVQLRAA